ncbi:TetR/AcrR family transcriptional regulator [Sneathiella chinensis]|uniref:TetR family transcriptional regulator n=1 Tax=Sneathiella chinensis TaxID=349750 RepID=A0ABQ5U5F4_9PROT|nr:TetR/AcrR family transcriptional regulator [Sneathiella chinensis]GLQ06991.1 TetR family transcriptional regulator [Sneathiella chinensis]
MQDISTDGNGQGRIRQENEKRIMKAAEKVFAQNGFRGATTASIAEEAGLPKANIHYYFGTKAKLYRAVVDDIVALWLSSFREITANDDPASTLADYIRAKMDLSRTRPEASRVFANELIRGAPRIKPYLEGDLKDWVESKAAILDMWVEQGKMAPVDSKRLIFHIWAMTQTWADFEVQWASVLGRQDGLQDADFDKATDAIISTVLRTCGLLPLPSRRHATEMPLTV